ncbi:hypothetical protein C943_04605 [Mariniradius saccharolyticus AK6]|uniref:Uncharacterized protein n=1 Tax=Mariniradius saccharolyticus AK6 TaxID=1239962 RepID=M7Y959_9BACT|nr:hypothetical protein C943_04605 [Mariniradius saccharolyticus AK6]
MASESGKILHRRMINFLYHIFVGDRDTGKDVRPVFQALP